MLDERNLKRLKAFLFTGFGLVIAGAFLPWAKLGPFSENGLDGDGAITLILGAGGAVVAFTDKRPRGMLIAVSVAALALVIGIVDYVDVADSEIATVGSGLYLTIVGSVLAVIAAGVLAFSLFKKPVPASATEPPQEPPPATE